MPDEGENAAGHGRRHRDSSILSPRFLSAAALAGWDEETLLSCLIVEDTPDREQKTRKRTTQLISKTPQSTSGRKLKTRRGSPSTVASVFNLEDDDAKDLKEGSPKPKSPKPSAKDAKKEAETGSTQKAKVSAEDRKRIDNPAPKTLSSFDKNLCQERLDRLREELSCVVCLDICFEPSTTPCGHSFCKRCLRSAIDKCGKKCPKCRQMKGNNRACTINTVLWNTIQLLFPEEIEAKKKASATNNAENKVHNGKTAHGRNHDTREQPSYSRILSQTTRRVSSIQDDDVVGMWRISGERSAFQRVSNNNDNSGQGILNQAEDAALALRLQREEFLGSLRGVGREFRASSLFSARENLRAMATRAVNLRGRNRSPT